MPKSTAIKLSRKTVPIICDELNLSEKDVEYEFSYPEVTYYYVKDCLFHGSPMRYMIYMESSFIEDFASVPPGIEDRFVPVTQVSSKP